MYDMSVPNARNSLLLPRVAQACSNLCKMSGAGNCVLLLTAPSRAREESGVDPAADEVEFSQMLAKHGFANQIPWFQVLDVPCEEQPSSKGLDVQ